MEPKKYIIILLTTLRNIGFNTKDELNDAIQTLKQKNKPFLILKYHHGTERYVLQKQMELN